MSYDKYEGCKEYSYKGCTFWYDDYVDILESRNIVSIYGCEGDVAEYPSTIEGYPVINICKREDAMNAHNCEVAIFPEGVTKIWQEAFRGSLRLKEVVVPKSIEFIAYQAFADCMNLTKVTLPWKKAMGIARAFQRSDNIQEIVMVGERETSYTLDDALASLSACMNAVRSVESGHANQEEKDTYETIEKNGWMIDVKEMM